MNRPTRGWQNRNGHYWKILSMFHSAEIWETPDGWIVKMIDRDFGKPDLLSQKFPTFTTAVERAEKYVHDYCEGIRRQVERLNQEGVR